MSVLDWFLWSTLFVFYIMCLVTVCVFTFKKGHVLLGILGIFFPFLWLIGAILPAKPGSRYEIEEGIRTQGQIQQMTR
jgi:hypothetical protein